ncbi:MAG: peptidoglycan DD-metalloendopeptidase family protein [Pseudomonadota bacterium]
MIGGAVGRWLAVLLAIGLPPCVFASKAKPQDELQEVRGRIEQLQKQLSEKEESRTEAADALKESEKVISKVDRRLHELSAEQQTARSEVNTMDGQMRVLQRRIANEKLRIEGILRSRYMDGGEDTLKMILSGQDPAEVSRQLYYYSYLSRARAQLIQQVKVDLAGFAELKAASEKKAEEIALLKKQEAEGKRELEAEKFKRKQVLAQISNQIVGQRKEIGRLKQNEQQLTHIIEEISRMLAKKRAEEAKKRAEAEAQANKKPVKKPKVEGYNQDIPDDSLSGKAFVSLKGKLKLPIKGELTNRFGSPREAGGLSWKGLFIRAETGQMVHAVADGRVVFADWLRGFGNLLILDHGGGYMSLYGYNESLLKAVGDLIKSGDAVARVGNTGGNLDSGLYFELRYQSKPLDPMSWVTK